MSPPIAIGVGCRKGCAASAIAAIVVRACDGLSMEGARMFTLDAKQHEPGLHEAATALALPLGFFSVEALRPMMPAVATRSARVEAAVGVPAVAEAAALAGAGPGGRLIVRRIAANGATCAVATAAPAQRA